MQLLYGKNKLISLDVPSSCLVVSNPAGSELSVEQLTQDAVSHPLGLPGVSNCFTPDDAVAIALGEGVIHQDEILPVLIDQLLANGIKKENVTLVVFGGKRREDNLVGAKPFAADSVLSQYNVHVHYTDQPQAYTIVSAMESGEPLAFVRPMVEADVVIPIGVADPVACASEWTSRLGVFSSVYPRFSMKEAHDRFEHPSVFGLDDSEETEELGNRQEKEGDISEELGVMSEELTQSASQNPLETRNALADEARQAGWELGVILLMEIIPGAGDSVAHVVFGTPDEVEKEVNRIHSDCVKNFNKAVKSGIGKMTFTRKPSQILCAVGGEESRQTWLNVIESLETAAAKGTDRCSIYLCADVADPIGRGFKYLMENSDLLPNDVFTVTETLYRERFPDSLLALRWLRLTERYRIYWLSNLDSETVEKLGAVPIEIISQFQRLINQKIV